MSAELGVLSVVDGPSGAAAGRAESAGRMVVVVLKGASGWAGPRVSAVGERRGGAAPRIADHGVAVPAGGPRGGPPPFRGGGGGGGRAGARRQGTQGWGGVMVSGGAAQMRAT